MGVEVSAGGVVVRTHQGEWQLAVIRSRGKSIWALPKGHVDGEETPVQAALREVREETGLNAKLGADLGEIQYVYQFRGTRIFKRVKFFLLYFESGEIDAIEPAMRIEVDEARWIPLAEAERTLRYRGEKEMVAKAVALLQSAKQPFTGSD